MSVLNSIRDRAAQLIESARQQVAAQPKSTATGAITQLGGILLGDFMALAQQNVSATGEEKKAAVMALAADFYDRVIEPIDLPGPDAVIDPILRATWLKGCEIAVDALFNFFKSPQAARVVAAFQS